MYNKKGEEITLDEDYDLTKGAYVLVSAKDQYGNAVTSLDWSANKNAIVQIAGGLTNLTAANTTSEEITVAGVKYAGIKLDKSAALGAGNATIIVISNGTGVTAQGTASVANGVYRWNTEEEKKYHSVNEHRRGRNRICRIIDCDLTCTAQPCNRCGHHS